MAKAASKAEMDAMRTGTVIHYVLERLIGEVGSESLGKMSESEIKLIVDKYLRCYLKMKWETVKEFSARFTYQFLRLSKMLLQCCFKAFC